MRWSSRTLAAALLVSLCGCGGDDSPATPSSPQRQLLTQGSGEVAPVSSGVLWLLPVQLESSAALEATVDWTNASTLIALTWGQGDCTRNLNCALFAQNSGTAKPKTLTTAALAAGTYTLAILNFGTAIEPMSYQIFVIR